MHTGMHRIVINNSNTYRPNNDYVHKFNYELGGVMGFRGVDVISGGRDS